MRELDSEKHLLKMITSPRLSVRKVWRVAMTNCKVY